MPYMEWLFVAFILLAISGTTGKVSFRNRFSPSPQVVFNTHAKEKIRLGRKLSNVVLKDGLLTIDFHNNHLLQREVVDEEEMKKTCRRRSSMNSAGSTTKK
jgi:hypothetical protein